MMRNSQVMASPPKNRSPPKRDANREWNEILMKTKSLEENLHQLKASINNNLKKIQRNKEMIKETTPVPISDTENNLLN
jgi:hypothetical protein